MMMKIKRLFGSKTRFALKCLAMFAIVSMTLFCATADVYAFSFVGYEVGLGGIHKEEKVHNGGGESEIETENMDGAQVRMMSADQIREAVRATNQNKHANLFLKSSFAGNNFCVMTEERYFFVGVSEDGSISLLSDDPDECYKVKTSEEYMMGAYNRYLDGEQITVKEINQNVDLPRGAKIKAFFGKGKSLLGLG